MTVTELIVMLNHEALNDGVFLVRWRLPSLVASKDGSDRRMKFSDLLAYM